MRPRVHVIATGGTISSVAAAEGAPEPELGGAGVLDRLEGLAHRVDVSVQDHSRVLSSQLTMSQLDALSTEVARVLREDPGLAGVVVLHGTGAMEESSFLTDLRHTDERPVVFTGAMIEMSSPTSDGPRNIASAIETVLAPASRGRGTLVVMNQEIHLAREVQKMHTTALDTFKSEHGPVGYVYPTGVTFARGHGRGPTAPDTPLEPAVDLIKFAVGMDGSLVRAAARAGARGLVIEGSGIGNVNDPVADAIAEAIANDVVVVVGSRCPYGRVYPHYGGRAGARALARLGCVLSSLPGTKSRVALMLALGRSRMPAAIQSWFDGLVVGERAAHA